MLLLSGIVPSSAARTYTPSLNGTGSTAIAGDAPAFIAWADGWHDYLPGAEVTQNFQTPEKALGPAEPPRGSVYDVVTLGRGGSIVMEFRRPIANGEGPDFAVFENSFGDGFLELAFVEVSSDGIHFTRFPSRSLTPEPQGAFTNLMDPTLIQGLAGKDPVGYGTPFDLADLPENSPLDRTAVRFVRLVDIVGDGHTFDSWGNPIYDPYPTVGSAGFDLDAVGALHLATARPLLISFFEVDVTGEIHLGWDGHDWFDYIVERSSDLVLWTEVLRQAGVDGDNSVQFFPLGNGTCFYRVRVIDAVP